MHANDTNNTNIALKEPIYKDLSYIISGVLFSAHNELGSYAREKQYGNAVARIFKEKNIGFDREVAIANSGNIVDLIVDNKIAIEFKAKRILTKEDYYQMQRYLQESPLKLGILVNFRDKLIKPKRIIRIDNWKK